MIGVAVNCNTDDASLHQLETFPDLPYIDINCWGNIKSICAEYEVQIIKKGGIFRWTTVNPLKESESPAKSLKIKYFS